MVNGGKKIEYGKNFQKIRFESDDDLPIVIRSVFCEDGKFQPHFFLDDAVYEL